MTGHPFGGVGLRPRPGTICGLPRCCRMGGELEVRILGRKTAELMISDHLPPATQGWAPGVRYGLGVSVLNDPAQAGNLGSRGQFGWPGFASTQKRGLRR